MPLWSHQQEAVRRLQHLSAAGLFHSMGAGKTRTAMELLKEWKTQKVLIVTPKTVMDVWRREFAKHAPEWRVTVLENGNTLKKRDYLEQQLKLNGQHAIVINYDSIWREPLGKRILSETWDAIVADEVHKCKSPGGVASRYMARLGGKVARRLGLTGSPTPHGPLDVYGIYRFLDPSIFGWSFTRFRARYAVLGGFSNHQVLKYINLEELHTKMYQIAHRVRTEDVLDIPPCRDEVITFDLSSAARKIYDHLEKDLIAEIDNNQTISVANVLAKLIRMQEITGGWAKVDESGNYKRIDHGKAEALTDILEGIGEEPIVIFYQYNGDFRSIIEIVEKLGLSYAELSGRRNEVRKFHAGEAQVLVSQMQSGSLGESFVRAAIQVYWSTGWSLGNLEQSRKRISRPGQVRPVLYYFLCAKRSVDEKIMKALEKRQELVTYLIDDLRHKS